MTNAESQQKSRQQTVGEIAATVPGATTVFRKFQLDFCCHGDIPLEDAARQRGISIADLQLALSEIRASDGYVPAQTPTEDLIEHILSRYHEAHRRDLIELIKLSTKVEGVHADHPQVPRGLASRLLQIQGELEVHMKKEELILFPAMRRSAASKLDGPISQMRLDHEDHGEHLQALEAITNGFILPDDACRSWQALYLGTSKLVNDVREHIHLENNVLFRRYEEPQMA